MSRHRTFPFALLLALAGSASAHQKWFYDALHYEPRWDLFFKPLPLSFVAVALGLTLVAGLLWRRRGGRGFLPGPEIFGDLPVRRSALYGLVPAILGIHLAVPLLVNGVQGVLFSPDTVLSGAWAYVLGLLQTGIALSLFYGGFTRLAALVLAGLWLLGAFVVGPETMLENILYLGFAGFFYLAGRGPIAVDRLLFPRLEPPAALMRYALFSMRTGLGLSLITLAFTEKLARLPYAEAFLQEYPLNFTAFFGLPLSNEHFVLFAGSVELLVGLFLLFGLFPREVILAAWLPFNLTLTYFNWIELVGHLPIYGALAVLLVWSPTAKEQALWVSGLREGPLSVEPKDAGLV